MNMTELRAKSAKELRVLAGQLKDKARELRFQLAGGKAKNVRELRAVKKDIAQILTVVKEKQKT